MSRETVKTCFPGDRFKLKDDPETEYEVIANEDWGVFCYAIGTETSAAFTKPHPVVMIHKATRQLTKNTRCLVRDLKAGDRFYKASDKKKIVFEMVEHPPTSTGYKHYHYFAKNDHMLKPQAFDGHTRVVFLRHKEEVPS